jgi:hypothetical protein
MYLAANRFAKISIFGVAETARIKLSANRPYRGNPSLRSHPIPATAFPRPLRTPDLPGSHVGRRYAATHASPSMALCPTSAQSSAAIDRPQCREKSLLNQQVSMIVPNVGGSADGYRHNAQGCLELKRDNNQTATQCRVSSLLSASDPTSVPSIIPCSKSCSGISSATSCSLTSGIRRCVHRLNLQPGAEVRSVEVRRKSRSAYGEEQTYRPAMGSIKRPRPWFPRPPSVPGSHPPDRISCPLTDIVLSVIRIFVYLKLSCRDKCPVSSRKVNYCRTEDSIRRLFLGVTHGNFCCNS